MYDISKEEYEEASGDGERKLKPLEPLYIVDTNKDWLLCMKILGDYLYTGSDDF